MPYRKILAYFMVLGWVGSLSLAWALDGVSYTALLDKEKIKIGEPLQFLVEIRYAPGTMVPSVTAPSFDQFSVQNEYQTTQEKGEGQEKYIVLKKFWLLTPNETGRLSIAAAIVTYQDPTTNLLKTGKTPLQFVTVEAADKAQLAEAADGPAAGTGARKSLFWLILAAGFAAAVLLLVLLPKLRSPAAPVAAARHPEEVAQLGLQQALEHVEFDKLDAYLGVVTATLQEYMHTKFSLDVHALSTPELLSQLQGFGFPSAQLAALDHFFQVADKAKFAGFVPSEDELILLHGTVKDFIEAGRRLKVPAKKRPA